MAATQRIGETPVHSEKAADPQRAAKKVTARLLREDPPRKNTVLVKPNIVRPAGPPVTTDPRVVRGILEALRDAGFADLLVAEGSGTGDTLENLRELGYADLGAKLVDLDALPHSEHSVPHAEVWDRIWLPDLLEEVHFISVPVLKEHSMLGVTIGLKNMVGVLPAAKYSGYWRYKKSQIHRDRPHACVSDLNRTARPDWVVVDATVGMKGSHIHGTPLVPPLRRVFGSVDALEADKHGCELLEHDWREIEYLRLIDQWWKNGERQ